MKLGGKKVNGIVTETGQILLGVGMESKKLPKYFNATVELKCIKEREVLAKGICVVS